METNKTKLTLSCNKDIIEEAKKYAELNNESVSNIVSEFLETYISINKNSSIQNNSIQEKIKLAKKFSGAFKLGNSRNYKDEYYNSKSKEAIK